MFFACSMFEYLEGHYNTSEIFWIMTSIFALIGLFFLMVLGARLEHDSRQLLPNPEKYTGIVVKTGERTLVEMNRSDEYFIVSEKYRANLLTNNQPVVVYKHIDYSIHKAHVWKIKGIDID